MHINGTPTLGFSHDYMSMEPRLKLGLPPVKVTVLMGVIHEARVATLTLLMGITHET